MDWKSIIEALCETYDKRGETYPQRAIAEYAGIDPSAVTRMKQGTLRRVSYDAGCKIMALYRKELRRQRRAGK